MESLGLIHVKTSASRDSEEVAQEGKYAYRKLRGIHKELPGASVEEFLAYCRADKERELDRENRA